MINKSRKNIDSFDDLISVRLIITFVSLFFLHFRDRFDTPIVESVDFIIEKKTFRTNELQICPRHFTGNEW